jgi:hypothetical protein
MGAFYFSFENDTKEYPYIPLTKLGHKNPTRSAERSVARITSPGEAGLRSNPLDFGPN